jgi:putative peptidoglycan lipid II flippase
MFFTAGGTLGSRVLGLARDQLTTYFLGGGLIASAFYLAILIPNLFRRLLGEGALTAALVPVMSGELEREGRAGAFRFLNRVLLRAAPLMAALALAGVLAAWGVASLAPAGSETALAAKLAMLALPYMPLVCLAAVFASALNVLGRFGVTALGAVWLNIAMIASLCVGGFLAGASMVQIAACACVGTVFGGVFQLAIPAAALWREGWRPRLDTGHSDALGKLAALLLPALAGAGVQQLNLVVSRFLAFGVEKGGLSAYHLANRLVELPVGLFAITVATVVFPLMSAAVARGDRGAAGTEYAHGMRLIFLFNIPAAAGLLALGGPLLRLLFEHGKFTAADTAATLPVLWVFAFTMPLTGVITLMSRALNVAGEMKSQARLAGWVFLVNIALSPVLALTFKAPGLAVANLVAAVFQCAMLWRLLRRRGAEFAAQPLRRPLAQCLAAAVVTGVFAAGAWWLAAPLEARLEAALGAKIGALAVLLPVIAVAAALCFVALGAAGFPELSLVRKGVRLIEAFGVRWVLFRVRYALRTRLGWLKRRTPQKTWDEVQPASGGVVGASVGAGIVGALPDLQSKGRAPRSRAESGDEVGGVGEVADGAAVADALDVLAGRFRLFGFHIRDAGRFPDWHRSPLGDAAATPPDAHWSTISDFANGDIKNIWELSRWPWAFALARAWRSTGDNAFAERFWELAEDWMRHNPPNSGANWKCGQETSFRLFAAVFARAALADAPATTPARLEAWGKLVRASADRIAANLDYALSQSNNHGVSECVGLLTAALLDGEAERCDDVLWIDSGAKFSDGIAAAAVHDVHSAPLVGHSAPVAAPVTADRSGRFALALRKLRSQLAALVYPDGGFSQHSAVYHRVLLHDLLWADFALRRLAGAVPPRWLRDAGARATRFLRALVDADTGRAHLYGANDGANILPLSDCDFADFRPVVQAGSRAFCGASAYAPGPWDELADWLSPPDTSEPAAPATHDALASGSIRVSRVLSGVSPDIQPSATPAHNSHISPHSHNSQPQSQLPPQPSPPSPTAPPPAAPPPAPLLPPLPEKNHFPDAGVLVWRRGPLSILLRCPERFRHRATRDVAHLSVLWRGVPILLNPGTFSYNPTGGAASGTSGRTSALSPFAAGFSSAFVHNTATCGDADQMEKLGRFLYLPWPHGLVVSCAADSAFEFASFAYRERFGAVHTRRLRLLPDAPGFIVEDIFESREPTSWRLHWLLPDAPCTTSATESTTTILPAAETATTRAAPTATAPAATAETATGTLDLRIPIPVAPAAPAASTILCSLRWETSTPATASHLCASPTSVRGWHSPHYQDAWPAHSLALSLSPARHTRIRTEFSFTDF